MREFRLDTVGPAGDCAVLRVAGEVDVYTAPRVRERIRELAAGGAVHLIADLSEVDFLDSTGLGVLVGGLKRLREDGGSLALVITAPRILRVFQITGLTKAFTSWPAVADAVAADPRWRKAVESEAGSVGDWCRQQGLSGRGDAAIPGGNGSAG
jgi:anti-sigma B factor antagonist